ncbi:DUF4434 domain-containing protein [Idiomarina abyssalis]|uniref:DUF4434 domain-containing protein n=1 Tax=Idiomarina abyssalis TaxID=86102 RepID=UPI001CD1CD6F|nr:DUF4434 domain-containing protein [Idiomarina abyssalis]
MFYQPFNSDIEWSDETWQERVCTLKYYGVKRLYIQWTKHDNSDFSQDSYWLLRRLAKLSKNFDIILGLYAEDAFFEAVNETFDADYLDQYLAQNKLWLKQLNNLNAIFKIPVEGFYLPGEFNDQVLANDTDRQQVISRLSHFRQTLEHPLYISNFYTGQLSPEEYIHALQQLGDKGIYVMHQDGRGTEHVTSQTTDELLGVMPPTVGIIEELFTITPRGDIHAQPSETIKPRLADVASSSAFFSLRYLPIVNDCMPSPTAF